MTETPSPGSGAWHGSLSDSRIMIVDDNSFNCELVAAYLSAAGLNRFEFASDGQEALDKIGDFEPDLVILDILMPRLDGFEVCRRLRADERWQRLPVLVQTALDSPEQRAEVFEAGATDLVTKPLNQAELIARVRIHLENRLLIRDLESYRRRIDKELHLARDMQVALLPAAEVMDEVGAESGLDIRAHFATSSELGGDFWGLHRLGQGRVGVFMTDFSGHGVNAALNTFRLHTVMNEAGSTEQGRDPAAYLAALNRRLVPLLPIEQYATMLYGVIDPAGTDFVYAAAASPGPMAGGIGDDVIVGDGAGLPLGIINSAQYELRRLPLPPGGWIFLYSDALTDSLTPDGGVLGEEGLRLQIADLVARGVSPDQLFDAVLDEFLSGLEGPLPDDLTAVLIRRRP